uniref:Nipsnap homolog 3A n=1 Tax=Latimeria chalumnae TaxID=7897 RepID=H3ASG7_LATCH
VILLTIFILKISKCLTRKFGICASISTGTQQQHGNFYEFRTYSVKPAKMTDFIKLTTENIHLRTAHSELLGYWTVEIGGLNQVFHIWKYDSYAQRAAVRTALAQNQEWQGKYISRMLPMLDKQHNEVTYLVPWCQIGKPPKKGTYELVTFQMKPGGPSVWGPSFEAAVNTHANAGYATLIGIFHSEYGFLNQVHALWQYESPDNRATGRHRIHEDARVVAAVRQSVSYLMSQENKLLIPTSFSPLK